MKSAKTPIVATLLILAIIALGGGGFILYDKLTRQTEANTKSLERFGLEMVGDRYSTTVGELGATQLPPSLIEEESTTEGKIIKGLKKTNAQLVDETKSLRSEIRELKAEIQRLQDYKSLNERFAPLSMEEELAKVERQIKAYLLRTPDAERFDTLQIEIMSAASTREYQDYITRNRLVIDDEDRKALVDIYLPGYAFCIGDGVALAANNEQEADKLASYFRAGDSAGLSNQLQQDLEQVATPCQLALRNQLAQLGN